MSVNRNSLINSGYLPVNERRIGSRTVYKYLLQNGEEATVQRAAQAVTALLSDNRSLCPTFETVPQNAFLTHVRDNPQLVINGRAVSLVRPPSVDEEVHTGCLDFFSETLLEEPIQCGDHYLERRRATVWRRKYPNECPAGRHRINSEAIHRIKADEITRLRNHLQAHRGQERERFARSIQEALREHEAHFPLVNRNALANSGYILANQRDIGTRNIEKYLLSNNEEASVQRAAQAVTALLRDNPFLCPLFEIEPQNTLLNHVRENPYLVLNGRALSLVRPPLADEEGHTSCLDLFSETLLSEPVRCHDHYLELNRLTFWERKYPGECPSGRHRIVSRAIDQDKADEIRRVTQHLQANRIQERERLTAIRGQERLSREEPEAARNAQTVQRLESLQLQQTAPYGNNFEILSGGIRLALDGAEYFGMREVTVYGTTYIANLPIIGTTYRTFMSIFRISRGEYVPALLEAVAGVASTVPGGGTALACGINAFLFIYDLCDKPSLVNMNVQFAHTFLNLPIPQQGAPNPTREQINNAYRQQAYLIHPDRMVAAGRHNRVQATRIHQSLEQAREMLIGHYRV